MKNYQDLKRFADANGFVVTSTNGGEHNARSKHFLGLAIDVRTRGEQSEEIERFIRKARLLGIIVRDERIKPAHQKVWTGAHLHLEIGAETSETIKRFQSRHGLIADGIVGAKTLAVLNSVV